MEKSSSVENTLEKRGTEVENMHTIANILGTKLDRRSIAILLELLEYGIHPESLADGKYRNDIIITIVR